MKPLRLIFAATALCGTLLCAQTPTANAPELLAVARLAPAPRLFPELEDIARQVLPFFPARAALEMQWAQAGLPALADGDAAEGPAVFAFSNASGETVLVLSAKYRDEATAEAAAVQSADTRPRLRDGARVFRLMDTTDAPDAPDAEACLKRAAQSAAHARCAAHALFEVEYFPALTKLAATTISAEETNPDFLPFWQNLSEKIDRQIDGGLFALARDGDILELSLSLRARANGTLARLLALPLGGDAPQAALLSADPVCAIVAAPVATQRAWMERLGALGVPAFAPDARARFEGILRALSAKLASDSEAIACDVTGTRTRALARPAPAPDVLHANLAGEAELARLCMQRFFGAAFSQTLETVDGARVPLLRAERLTAFAPAPCEDAPDNWQSLNKKSPDDYVADDGAQTEKSEAYFAVVKNLLASASSREGVDALVDAVSADTPVADSVADRLGTDLPPDTFFKATLDLPACAQEFEAARTGEPLSQVGLALNALKTAPAVVAAQSRDGTAALTLKIPLSSAAQIARAYARAFFNAQ